MEEFAEHPMSLLIYKSCMDTIALLSKFKRGMGSKLEAKVLQLAIKRTIDRGLRQQDVCNKVMYDQASSALNIMLRALLAEDPTWKHLQTILGHFTEFLDSEDPATKREALVMSSSLQRLADRCGIDCIAVNVLKGNPVFLTVLPEVQPFLRLLLTVPVSTSTAKWSFSMLRRLKNYLRSTVTQKHLNHLALLDVHTELAKEADLDAIADKLISRAEICRATFALKI
ncbi:hypothetical protein lerEdw1_007200 [Lerista edwardsae]|nr:hypothetical protein lerEdw1_007200 [Lerista edwardsae]